MKKTAFITLTFLFFAALAFGQTAFQVAVSGKGQPVIYLPGFTCPGKVWDETRDALGSGFQSHQVTYAGFGGVPAIALPWYSEIANQLADYLEKNDLKNAIVIGHSMGGMLALDLATRQPERISKLILADALPCIREIMMPGVPAEQLGFDNPYSRQMLEMSDSALRVTATYMAQGMTLTASRYEELIGYTLQADRNTYVKGYIELLKLDLRPMLPQITTPTLILSADSPSREVAMPVVTSQFSGLTNKTIEMASGARHFVMYDQPEWFFSKVNSFIRDASVR